MIFEPAEGREKRWVSDTRLFFSFLFLRVCLILLRMDHRYKIFKNFVKGGKVF